MSGKISVYNLGQLGVDVVKTPVHIDDGAFTKAQNAQLDTVQGVGGIRKRDGMARHNSSAMAGAVRGVIGLPLADPNSLTRWFYIPIDDHGGAATGTWRRSSNGTSWSTVAVGGIPVVAESIASGLHDTAFPYWQDFQPWIALNNAIYYPSNDYTHTTDDVPIHRFDGSVDYRITQIPNNAFASTTRQGRIGCIFPYDERTMLLSIQDEDQRSRILLLDTRTGQITTVASQSDWPFSDINGLGYNAVPGGVALFQGRIFVALANLSGVAASRVYWARATSPTWTYEAAGDTTPNVCLGAAVFKGDLYLAYGATTAIAAKIRKRTPAGSYSTVLTSGSTTTLNYYGPLIVSRDGAKMYTFQDTMGGTSVSGNTADSQVIFSTTDGSAWTKEYDVGLNVNNLFNVAGYPNFDTNGDLYWCITKRVSTYDSVILKRTNAGVWSIVDNNSAHLKGPVVRLKF